MLAAGPHRLHGKPELAFWIKCFINLKEEVLGDRPGTVLVHCSAGVGRTGTFIALYKLIQDYLNEDVSVFFIAL